MDDKKAIAEFLGSLTLVMFAFGGDPMFTGLLLCIIMMVFKGAEVLPMVTIANMATGKTEAQQGAINFAMQVLGGLMGTVIMGWRATGALGEMGDWTAGGSMDATAIAGAIIGGFVLGLVWDRIGGATWQGGIMVWALAAGGMVISTASEIGAMVVTGGWDSAVVVLATMACGAVGLVLASMLGEKVIFSEEE